MNAPFSIRELTADEREETVALWERAKLTRPWNDPYADFDQAIAGPTSTVLGAFSDETLVAAAMAGFDGHRGWVYYVAVDRHRRHEGLGRTIMSAAEGWLHGLGAKKVQLMVRKDNAAVIDFYDHLGYSDDQVVVLSRRFEPTPEGGHLNVPAEYT